MEVVVVGAGHVGLVTAACLADFGISVECVDKNTAVIDGLNGGTLPFHEPGLKDIVQKNYAAGRLAFSINVEEALRRTPVIFVAVGTDGSDGMIQLDAVYEVADTVAHVMNEYKVVVLKSTVTVGTARVVAQRIRNRQSRPVPFDIVSNPEFLREGAAIETFMKPDRVVIGVASEKALSIMHEIYRPLYLIETPFVTTTNETAELIKFAANAFLAVKISFINEFANLCDAFGCDVHVLARAIGLDGRIGRKFLHPGPGFGGSCLPKDTRAISWFSRQAGVSMNVVEGAVRTNDEQAERVLKKIQRHMGSLSQRIIAVLGLAYKTNTDDIRDSPAIRVCKLLLESGARLHLHDPAANESAHRVLNGAGVTYFGDPYAAARGADGVVVLTEWNEFRNLDLGKLKSLLAGNVLVDARNIYDPQAAADLGFLYEGMGRTVPANEVAKDILAKPAGVGVARVGP